MFRASSSLLPLRSFGACSFSAHLPTSFSAHKARPNLASSFHTTAPTLESAKKQRARLKKKRNLDLQAARAAEAYRTRPHPALGVPDNDTETWKNCRLAKVTITEERIDATHIPDIENNSDLQRPSFLNFQLGGQEERLLFSALPEATTKQSLLMMSGGMTDDATVRQLETSRFVETAKANVLARIVDLRNASAQGIAAANRQICIQEFSVGKPNNTGCPEVQAAIMTLQIRNLWAHLQKHKHDIHNRRSLRALIHKRKAVLQYLSRLDRQRFEILLKDIAVDERAFTGEIMI